jgi:hypothetical protein
VLRGAASAEPTEVPAVNMARWFEEEVYVMLKKHIDVKLLAQYREMIDEMKEMKEG